MGKCTEEQAGPTHSVNGGGVLGPGTKLNSGWALSSPCRDHPQGHSGLIPACARLSLAVVREPWPPWCEGPWVFNEEPFLVPRRLFPG